MIYHHLVFFEFLCKGNSTPETVKESLMYKSNNKQLVYKLLTTEDLRSFYASVSCIKRGLDSRYTKLTVVGDVNRSGSIVLAATPQLKAQGVKKISRLYIDVFLVLVQR